MRLNEDIVRRVRGYRDSVKSLRYLRTTSSWPGLRQSTTLSCLLDYITFKLYLYISLKQLASYSNVYLINNKSTKTIPELPPVSVYWPFWCQVVGRPKIFRYYAQTFQLNLTNIYWVSHVHVLHGRDAKIESFNEWVSPTCWTLGVHRWMKHK